MVVWQKWAKSVYSSVLVIGIGLSVFLCACVHASTISSTVLTEPIQLNLIFPEAIPERITVLSEAL